MKAYGKKDIYPSDETAEYSSPLRVALFGHIFGVSFTSQYAYTVSVRFLKAMPKPSQLRNIG